jgi:hypothetical protein
LDQSFDFHSVGRCLPSRYLYFTASFDEFCLAGWEYYSDTETPRGGGFFLRYAFGGTIGARVDGAYSVIDGV